MNDQNWQLRITTTVLARAPTAPASAFSVWLAWSYCARFFLIDLFKVIRIQNVSLCDCEQEIMDEKTVPTTKSKQPQYALLQWLEDPSLWNVVPLRHVKCNEELKVGEKVDAKWGFNYHRAQVLDLGKVSFHLMLVILKCS